jgi:hypothetical protein
VADDADDLFGGKTSDAADARQMGITLVDPMFSAQMTTPSVQIMLAEFTWLRRSSSGTRSQCDGQLFAIL